MTTVKRRSTVPYYACSAVWILYALLFPLYRPGHFVLVAAAAALVFFAMRRVCPDIEEQVPDRPQAEKPTGNAELDRTIRDGRLAVAEMERLSASIRDPKVSADIERLAAVSGKIFEQVKADPSRLPQIRRFMDHYLPTTIKLLNAYDRMGSSGVSGENIDSTMKRVENVMDTIVSAFEKQLDALYGAEAMDISTDITVLENLLRSEGLADDGLRGERHAAAEPEDIRLEL